MTLTLTVQATHRPRSARGGILAEIAARRARDVAAELGDVTYMALVRAAGSAPTPRPIAERLAAPGLHLIAEVKRSSPSAGASPSAATSTSRRSTPSGVTSWMTPLPSRGSSSTPAPWTTSDRSVPRRRSTSASFGAAAATPTPTS